MTNIIVPTPGPANAMHFCANRLNSQTVNQIIRANLQGLSDTDALDTALRVGDYVSVLRPLWAERNRSFRLDWLRMEEKKFHPVLPFERAMAEFKANPTRQTLVEISLPHLVIASFRNEMDALCSTDKSIAGPCGEMKNTYDLALIGLVEKLLPSALSEGKRKGISLSSGEGRTRLEAILSLLRELEEELVKEASSFPSPTWLEHYGLSGFSSAFGMEASGMKPKEQWNQIRLDFVRERIAEGEKVVVDQLADTLEVKLDVAKRELV